MLRRYSFSLLFLVVCLSAQTPTGNPTGVAFNNQDYQRPQNCLPCHQRQFDELRSSVKSGYRNVSPLFNGLELSANFLTGGLLRPVYATSTKTLTLPNGMVIPFNTNMFTTPVYQSVSQIRAGFCLGCHNGPYMKQADNPALREVPDWPVPVRRLCPRSSGPCATSIWWTATALRSFPPPLAAILRPARARLWALRVLPATCATTCRGPTCNAACKATALPTTASFTTTPSKKSGRLLNPSR